MKTPTLSRWRRIPGHPVVLVSIMLCLIPFSVVLVEEAATQNPTVSISGSVTYFSGDVPVGDVALALSGGASDAVRSDTEGHYQFTGLETGLDYAVTPAKEKDDTPVSALDASCIVRYLVHATELDQYQMNSGDVTVDGHLTAFDATVILRHIVHETNVPGHRIGAWSFAPESLFYPALSADQTDRDYTGLIIGDVSGNWRQQVIPEDTVNVWFAECDAQAGKPLRMNLSFGDLGVLDIFSAECVVSYHPGILIFDSLATEGTPYPDIGAVMYATIDDGEISIAWAGVEAPREGGTFVALVFHLSPDAQTGEVCPVNLESFMFNEGDPFAATEDGIVRVAAATEVEDNHGLRSVPEAFSLSQNFPNPFNPATAVNYQIPMTKSQIHTTLKVYNIMGQEVATLVDEIKEPGYYTATWNASDMPSGIYFYHLTAGDFSQTRRMILLK